MRKHVEFEVEKVLGELVLIFVRFVYFSPNISNVDLYLVHNSFSIVAAVVEISKNKHQLFSTLLPEQLQVALKNDFEESVVRRTISADILCPHVDDEDVSNGQCQHTGGLLEGGSLISSLLGICSLYIENQV